MATVMTAMADDGVSVVLSSHLLADLERVADYLVLIAHGQVRINGPVDELLGDHRLLTGPIADPAPGNGWEVVESSTAGAHMHRLVRLVSPHASLPVGTESRAVGVEELALAYLRQSTTQSPTLAGAAR